MRLYELINRLENIRDKMESTFRNEFLKGEIENLIEELKEASPEVAETPDTEAIKLSKLPNNPYWVPYNPATGASTGTNTPYITWTSNDTSGSHTTGNDNLGYSQLDSSNSTFYALS